MDNFCLEDAIAYFKCLDPEPNSKFLIQTFIDEKQKEPTANKDFLFRRKALCKTFLLTISEFKNNFELIDLVRFMGALYLCRLL